MKKLIVIFVTAMFVVSCTKESTSSTKTTESDSTSSTVDSTKSPVIVDSVVLTPEEKFIEDFLTIDSSYVDSLGFVSHIGGTEEAYYNTPTATGTIYTTQATDEAGNPYAIVFVKMNGKMLTS